MAQMRGMSKLRRGLARAVHGCGNRRRP